jgi:hypothetical protein
MKQVRGEGAAKEQKEFLSKIMSDRINIGKGLGSRITCQKPN